MRRFLYHIETLPTGNLTLYGFVLSMILVVLACVLSRWRYIPLVEITAYLIFILVFSILSYVRFFSDIKPIKLGLVLSLLTGLISIAIGFIFLKLFNLPIKLSTPWLILIVLAAANLLKKRIKSRFTQITYDSFLEMFHINLNPDHFSENIIEKIEKLKVNSNIALEFGKKNNLIGLKIFGNMDNNLINLVGQNGIFRKITKEDGTILFSLKLSDLPIIKDYASDINKGIVFNFSDDSCKNLIGIDLHDTKNYTEPYLVNSTFAGV